MDTGLKGRVAMVAAASKGLGLACARSLLREGCRVSICSRNEQALLATAASLSADLSADGEVIAIPADVSSTSDLESWHQSTLRAFGDVDILVTNTGGPPVRRFMELEDDDWKRGVESTLMNVVRLSRLVIPAMRQRRHGRIIHLTSLVARQPVDELTISSTLRAGLSGLTRTMASQFGPDGITVNAILTGHFATDRQFALADAHVREKGITREEYFEKSALEIPLRRFGDPGELGDIVAFLASDRAAYITGASIPVDGGAIRSTF